MKFDKDQLKLEITNCFLPNLYMRVYVYCEREKCFFTYSIYKHGRKYLKNS